ncbi:PREDICTED: uncharacterized protein K02A2.6-like [Priapulus caudatus]|uniref:RNA-directed DNA polymerase n=1 Tax=Priapulus caudatus TaxID=37621 RepID=A0ABM1E6U7_PRICU|nr:PREDICTED: uncharacterized protein K02A2.6-like [Priapulus caudatus]
MVDTTQGVKFEADTKLTPSQAGGDARHEVEMDKYDRYPLPTPEDLFATLSGGVLFTKLDMAHAYQQIELDERSKQYTTINTHRGLFVYSRLAFGISSAPAIFQRVIENLLAGIPRTAVYLDDILVSGASKEEHQANLKEVLRRLTEAGLRLKKNKCCFGMTSVQYLGHQVSKDGLATLDNRVIAIVAAPKPKDVTQVRAFLGMLTFYLRFLPHLASTLEPLHRLLKKGYVFSWGTDQDRAFNVAKELLRKAPVLTHYDVHKPLLLTCDASAYGVGAVLAHEIDGDEHPVCYHSRTLQPAEKNYAQVEKEALAMMRWALILQGYDYELVYRPGPSIANADALSRLPLPQTMEIPVPPSVVNLMQHLEGCPVTCAMIQQDTKSDSVMARVVQYVLQGWPDNNPSVELMPYFRRRTELSCEDGCVLWGTRVVVPDVHRAALIEELHEAHPGASRMKSLACNYVWWPSIDSDLEVKSCISCQVNRSRPAKAPLHPWEYAANPWSRIHVDFAGPFLGHMFLVIADSHTKWLEVFMMQKITSQKTVEKLRFCFATHGLPDCIVSDNGPTFTSEEFAMFISANGIRHTFTAPYHPSSNGLAERAVQSFKEGMKRMQTDSLQTRLTRWLANYRLTPHSTTGRSPAELLLRRRPKSRLDLVHPRTSTRVKEKQKTQKQQHNQHVQDRSFNPGDSVMARNFANGPTWLPGNLLRRIGPLSFTAQLQDGRIVRRHQDHLQCTGNLDAPAVPEQVEDPANPEFPVLPEVTSREVPREDPPLPALSAAEALAAAPEAAPGGPVAGQPASPHRTALPELEEFCLRFALNHMTAVIQSEAFAELDEATLRRFIQRAATQGAFK